jgi:hypothetical protein
MPYPPRMPMAPPPKKGMSGCVIALLVVGGVALVFAIAAGIGVYFIATSSTAKTAFKVINEGSKLAEKGINAPGMTELRALGCDEAITLDTDDVGALVQDLFDGGFDSGMPAQLMIACQVRDAAKAPKCDDLAAEYLRAVKTPTHEYVVTVQKQGDKTAICESTYDTSGRHVPHR